MDKNLIIKFDVLNSTSLKAKELFAESLPWTAIVAREQSSGHGKEKSAWFSPQGGLYFSVILPNSNIKDLQTITILTAFSIAKIIKKNFQLEPMIKLPNDIFINNKKICGILTENIIGKNIKSSVIGIGLNTNIDKFPVELKQTATSISKECHIKVDNQKILKQIINEIKLQFKEISN